MPTFEERIRKVPNVKLYVLRYGDFGLHLVGPFNDQAAAHMWSIDPVNNPNDDPRWQCIGLVAPEQAPAVYTPEAAAKITADLMSPELGLRPLDHVF
jgi:hypothetical protein